MTIGIIGFGRFGKFYSDIWKQFGSVIVYSHRDVSKDCAEMGIAQGTLKNVCLADIVIIACAISDFEKTVKEIRNFLRHGTIVMDVCSVKIMPCVAMKKYFPKKIELLGTHPMFGPDSAKNGLIGLKMVLCPVRISDENLSFIKNYFKKLHLEIIETTPKIHDKESARSLCMVHFLGRGLEKLNIKKMPISTMGYERVLQVSENVTNDSMELFRDMQKFNPYAKKEREKLLKALYQIEKKF